MKTIKYIALFFLLTFFTTAYTQSARDAVRILENEIGLGTRALGMGGAYVGLADDYSAIYWNPAGLAAVKHSQFVGEVSHLNFNNTATFSNEVTDQSQNYTRLRSLGMAFPLPTLRGSLVFALGYNRVKDFDQNLQFSGFNPRSNGLVFNINDEPFEFDENVYQFERVVDEGGLNQWSLGAGIALSPNFTAGATATIWDGDDDYEFTFFQEDRNNIYDGTPGTMNYHSYQLNRAIQADYEAFGLKLGGMFELANGLKLGTAIQFPVTFTVHETFAENDLLVFDDGFEDPFEYPTNEFEYKVKTPFQFDGGASFNSRLLTLSGDVRYRDWSQTKFDVPDEFLADQDYVELLEENKVIRTNYRATLQYNLGGEIFLPGLRSKLRGGYAVFPTPFEDASDEMDKKYFTGGISFLIDRYVSLDFAYLRGSWKQESEDDLTPGGTFEDITTNKVLVGLVYKF
ncbi:MAG: hypothetical protein GWN62_35735 [Aliifodinibius sp.]|nr:hypothetical protein [Fodinibius sp.]